MRSFADPSEGRRRLSKRLSDIDIGEEGVQLAIALPSGSGLSRDLSDPCNPLLTYAQKPRTEAEEKSCSSHCRAKEAVR